MVMSGRLLAEGFGRIIKSCLGGWDEREWEELWSGDRLCEVCT